MVAGQRSVAEEWLESFKVFGIGAEDGKKIIHRLGQTLLNEHEKLFGSYWRHTFGPPSSLLQLLGKGISVCKSLLYLLFFSPLLSGSILFPRLENESWRMLLPWEGNLIPFFLGTGTSVREDLASVPTCEADFASTALSTLMSR